MNKYFEVIRDKYRKLKRAFVILTESEDEVNEAGSQRTFMGESLGKRGKVYREDQSEREGSGLGLLLSKETSPVEHPKEDEEQELFISIHANISNLEDSPPSNKTCFSVSNNPSLSPSKFKS
jgi:hypothetical protein